MASEVILYRESLSPAGVKARALLARKGIDARQVVVHPALAPFEAWRLGVSRLPVLALEGKRLGDWQIAPALDAAVAGPSLLPADPQERARARLLEAWADTTLGAIVERVRWRNGYNRPRLLAELEDEPLGLAGRMLTPLVPSLVALRHLPEVRFGRTGDGRDLSDLAHALDEVERAILPSGWLVSTEPCAADFAVAAQVAALRGLDGWETVKMRRKTVKLAKALLPEQAEGSGAEAYDAADQAFIEASRLRRATSGS